MYTRRCCVFEENPREETPLVQVKTNLPVSEPFGFIAALRQATSGQASDVILIAGLLPYSEAGAASVSYIDVCLFSP